MIGAISYLIFQTIIIFIIAAFFIVSSYYSRYYKKSREEKISHFCENIGTTLILAFIVDIITYMCIK